MNTSNNSEIVLEEIYDTIDKVKGHIYKIICNTTNKIYNSYYGRNWMKFLEYLHVTERGRFIFDDNSVYGKYARELYSKYNIKR